MADKIFIVGTNNTLTKVDKAKFDNEDMFQRLLAEHPAILTGSTGVPPLLIKRELGVPDTEAGANRWSLDHLYIDERAVPILVEVKRASDTRLRREVVGQMLDYAANGSAHWTRDILSAAFEATCGAADLNATDVLTEFIANGFPSTEAFWDEAAENLAQGRIRMLIVADEIPPELERIILFLAGQMRRAEIAAVRVDHYPSADGARVLVPHTVQLIGADKNVRGAVRDAEDAPFPIAPLEWVAQLGRQCGGDKAHATRKLVDWHIAQGGNVGATKSQDALAMSLPVDNGEIAWPLFVRAGTGGRLEVSLKYLRHRPYFAADEARKVILDRMNGLRGVAVRSTGNLVGWPSFPVEALLDDRAWMDFTELASWIYQKARASVG